jgi:hypothetical protein
MSTVAKLGGLVIAAACASACGRGDVQQQKSESVSKGERAMSTHEDFFKMIQDLVTARPFTVDGVSKVTKHKFALVPKESNAYFEVFAAQDEAHASFRAAELRMPKAGATARDGILVLTVQPKVSVSQKEVKARFGENPELSFQTHRRPPDGPTYFVYRFAWGKVSFGFDGKGQELLQSVTIDATGN